ncbi:MAG: CDP-alcohol phosphatidyltransferase family protein [Deltaproteobacteria bacterium]|nr:CDP-alcohol phosphatidyltransferase family protein [Deltaproteobacteria bacterium]
MNEKFKDKISSALIICNKDSFESYTVAGLSIGERLLLSLYYGGIKKVSFIGNGKKPECSRINLEIVEPAELKCETGNIFICHNDLVFDNKLLKEQLNPDILYPFKIQPSDTLDLNQITENIDFSNHQVLSDYMFALRVNDAETLKKAKTILFRSLIKPIDGFISKNVNRKFSLFITSGLIKTSLTPNQVTFFSMIIGMFSGIAAYFGGEYFWSLIIAGVLFQTQSMLDGCDGEIARLKYMFSLKGQWLDTISDDLTNYIFFLGLGLGLSNFYNVNWLSIVTIIIVGLQIYSSLIMYQRIYKMNTGDLLAIPNMVTGGEPRGKIGKILRIIHIMTKKDFFVFITSIFTIIQLPVIAYILIGCGTLLMAPSLTINEIKIRKAIKNKTLKL